MSDNILDPHDPTAINDYAVEWATLLAGETETALASSAWSASTPAGLTISSTTLSGTKAVVWVTGGTPGRTYGLTNTVVTSGSSRKHPRTIFIPCRKL